MAATPNYIKDLNPFSLAGPPNYWLSKLWDFDNSLVVVPSRQGFYYRLAQRRKLTLSERVVNEALFKQSDTQMLANHSLVPVTTVIATANWNNPYMFVELANRAPHRMGGAEKVNKLLEAQDKQDILAKRATVDEHLNYLSHDAWNFYQMKRGVRSHMWSPKSAPVTSVGPAKKGQSATVFPSQFMGR